MPSKSLSFGEKITGFLGNPNKTFESVEKESWKSAFKFYAILLPISVILGSVLTYLLFPTTFSLSYFYLPFTPLIVLVLGIVITYVSDLLLTFVGSAWLHLWIRAVGGKKGYKQTLKASYYSSTPLLFLGWIPLVGGLVFGIWSLVLNIFGLMRLQKLSGGRAVAAVLLAIFVAVVIIVVILLVWLFTVGLPYFMSQAGYTY